MNLFKISVFVRRFVIVNLAILEIHISVVMYQTFAKHHLVDLVLDVITLEALSNVFVPSGQSEIHIRRVAIRQSNAKLMKIVLLQHIAFKPTVFLSVKITVKTLNVVQMPNVEHPHITDHVYAIQGIKETQMIYTLDVGPELQHVHLINNAQVIRIATMELVNVS